LVWSEFSAVGKCIEEEEEEEEKEGGGGGGRVFVRGGAVTHECIVERCFGGLNAFPIAARVQPA